MNFPVYYHYFNRTLKIEGDSCGSVLNLSTGEFDEADFDDTNKATSSMGNSEIWQLEFDEFALETEAIRLAYLNGSGPVFELYDSVRRIIDNARSERRVPTSDENALIDSLFRRSYSMWDDRSKIVDPLDVSDD